MFTPYGECRSRFQNPGSTQVFLCVSVFSPPWPSENTLYVEASNVSYKIILTRHMVSPQTTIQNDLNNVQLLFHVLHPSELLY